jgi:hypothetical protein
MSGSRAGTLVNRGAKVVQVFCVGCVFTPYLHNSGFPSLLGMFGRALVALGIGGALVFLAAARCVVLKDPRGSEAVLKIVPVSIAVSAM